MTQSAPDNNYKQNAPGDNYKKNQFVRHVGNNTPTIVGNPPIKKTIVPVIYLPGIFGSRLENPAGTDKDTCFVWDPNRKLSLMYQYAKGITTMFLERSWKDREIDNKVKRLHNPGATVMKDHRYKGKDSKNDNDSIITHILNSPTFTRLSQQYDLETLKNNEWVTYDDGQFTHTELAKKLAQEEYDRRSKRGWYGVWNTYDKFLEAIHELDDSEFIYPVYAFGYDWRFDLKDVAKTLNEKITEWLAIQDYPDFGVKGEDYEIHSKAIIVTHSQGSLVARYAMKVLGSAGQIQAVVHLDQPTTGAPLLYRRFITGTGPERTLFGFTDKVFGAILGNNPYHFTQMAAPLAGALSLLPTNDYTAKQGDAKHQWLYTEDPKLKFSKPITDVYTDVYLGEGEEKNEKWSLISCKRYDAAGQPKPYQEKEFDRVRDPITGEEYPRHTFGDGPLPAEATILPPPSDNPYRSDNHRLRPHAELDDKTATIAENYWEKFKMDIGKAQKFHADLKLDQHQETHVVRSRGVKTVTQVTFNLNDKGMLECPYVRTADGDGTVPLTSQEALLFTDNTKAQPAGKIIEGGEHAEICGHPEAMQQVKELLRGSLVAGLRPKVMQA